MRFAFACLLLLPNLLSGQSSPQEKDTIIRDLKLHSERQRYYSVVESVAETSLETKSPELSALLALHAFELNRKYQGYSFNSKIYEALFESLLKYGEGPAVVNTPIEFPKANHLSKREEAVIARAFQDKVFSPVKIIFGADYFLASICSDSVVRIWNQRELNQKPIRLANLGAADIQFAKDGFGLLILTKMGSVIRVDLNFENLAKQLCKKNHRNLTQQEWDLYLAEDLPRSTLTVCSSVNH